MTLCIKPIMEERQGFSICEELLHISPLSPSGFLDVYILLSKQYEYVNMFVINCAKGLHSLHVLYVLPDCSIWSLWLPEDTSIRGPGPVYGPAGRDATPGPPGSDERPEHGESELWTRTRSGPKRPILYCLQTKATSSITIFKCRMCLSITISPFSPIVCTLPSAKLYIYHIFFISPQRRERGHGVFQHRGNIETALNFLKSKSV